MSVRGKPSKEVLVAVVKSAALRWLLLAGLLIVVGLFVVSGAAGSVILAGGFLAVFGVAIRVISRSEPAPQEERRVPAGHSGRVTGERSDRRSK
jgi:hypothetical protein